MNFIRLLLILSISFFSFTYSAHKELTKRKELTEQEKLDKTLFDSATNGDLENVIKLLAQGANPDGFKDKYTSTALHKLTGTSIDANDKNNLEIIKLLISAGANVNGTSLSGAPILKSTINRRNPQFFDILIKNGANINFRNRDGQTLLMESLQMHKVLLNIVLVGNDELNAQIKTNAENTLPYTLNLFLFHSNFEYNLDLKDNEGRSIDYYIENLPDGNTKNWVKASLETYKFLQQQKIKYRKECLQEKIPEDLSNIIEQYLGEVGFEIDL